MDTIAPVRRAIVGLVAIFAASTVFVHAAEGIVASKSLTVLGAGPRQGSGGSNYFNIQGKNKEKYAGFGLLVFPLPKGDGNADVKTLTLALVQSIPAFSADGKIKFYLAQPLDAEPSSLEKLKYDPTAAGGLAKDAFKSLQALGAGEFKKIETGKSDTFVLSLDDMARDELRSLLKTGGSLHIVVAPADDDVAATYFGAGNETEANRPPITLAGETPK
jgi:hypothetical protein